MSEPDKEAAPAPDIGAWTMAKPGTRPMPSPGAVRFHLVAIPDYGEVIDLAFDGEDEFRAAAAEYLDAFDRREFRGDIRMYIGGRIPVPDRARSCDW